MAKPRFLSENLFDQSIFGDHTVSANEEASGHEAFRVGTTRRTRLDFWTPTTDNQAAWLKVDAGADAGLGSPVDGAALRLGDDNRPFEGTAEENLIRDAAMDTDTDGDGVVDGFGTVDNVSVTYSLDQSAQKIAASPSSNGFARAHQAILRVFPGDEVLYSAELKLNVISGTNIEAQIEIDFLNEQQLSNMDSTDELEAVTEGFTNTSFQRQVASGTAPDGTVAVRVTVRLQFFDESGGDAEAWFRNARLLRAASDPATYANPHVSGGSQTGDTLDTAGWPASRAGIVKAGDWIRPGGSGATQQDAEDELGPWMQVAADADSDGNGDATIQLTEALTGRRADMIVVDRGHNLAGQTVTLETSEDDSAWSEVFSVTVPESTVERTKLDEVSSESSGVRTPEGAWLLSFDATSGRYWRFTVSAMGADNKPEIRGLWLGESYEPNFDLEVPWGFGDRALDYQMLRGPTLWTGAGRSARRREIEVRLRLSSWAEYNDTARRLIEELVLRDGNPVWFVADQDWAERAWLGRAQPGTTGFQRREGWGFPQADLLLGEHQPKL